MARKCVRLQSLPTATPCSPRHDARVTRGELVTSVPLHNELASHSLPPHGVPPPTHPHPPQTRTHTRSHMRVALLSPRSHLSLPASHCFPRVTHNRSLHSLSRSPTRCVLDDVTALAISLTHLLRARRRHCTRPLAHPLAACSTTSLHSPFRFPLAACSTTPLHSPTRSPTRRESNQAKVVWWGSAPFWTTTGARGLWREKRQ